MSLDIVSGEVCQIGKVQLYLRSVTATASLVLAAKHTKPSQQQCMLLGTGMPSDMSRIKSLRSPYD